MVDVANKRCSHPGCTKRLTYGKDGSNKSGLCSQHANYLVVGVVSTG
ncbi:unnamed protein product [Ectocarpus fasciculatus]